MYATHTCDIWQFIWVSNFPMNIVWISPFTVEYQRHLNLPVSDSILNYQIDGILKNSAYIKINNRLPWKCYISRLKSGRFNSVEYISHI